MRVTTRGEFFRLLKKSRLLTSAQRVTAKAICRSQFDPADAASELVRHDLLTSWQAAQLLLGRTRFHIGKYKLLKFRGRGAMGIVFKAEQPNLNRPVAVKILSGALLDQPRSVARFLREIRSTAVLNHPNLVVAYDADQIGKTYCLVMEYVSGRSLKAICLERGRLPVAWSCECIRQAALALAHIHERGLVHRDVKPSNMIVAPGVAPPTPHVKLLDIGLARFVSESEEDGGLTRDGQIVGTGDYMAPEQVASARRADIRADIYGLGATLFQMLTGSPPLLGATFLQTYVNRLQREPPLVPTLGRRLPRGLDSLIAKMLKKDPQERYQTPEEVAADLAAVLAGAPPQHLLTASRDHPSENPVVAPSGAQAPPSAASLEMAGRAAGLSSNPVESINFDPFENTPGPVDRVDSVSDLSIAGLGSTADGTGLSEISSDGSLNEFLSVVGDSSADDWPNATWRRRSKSSSGRVRGAFAAAAQKSSELVQLIARLLSDVRSGGGRNAEVTETRRPSKTETRRKPRP